jgi:hypothetical protein
MCLLKILLSCREFRKKKIEVDQLAAYTTDSVLIAAQACKSVKIFQGEILRTKFNILRLILSYLSASILLISSAWRQARLEMCIALAEETAVSIFRVKVASNVGILRCTIPIYSNITWWRLKVFVTFKILIVVSWFWRRVFQHVVTIFFFRSILPSYSSESLPWREKQKV